MINLFHVQELVNKFTKMLYWCLTVAVDLNFGTFVFVNKFRRGSPYTLQLPVPTRVCLRCCNQQHCVNRLPILRVSRNLLWRNNRRSARCASVFPDVVRGTASIVNKCTSRTSLRLFQRVSCLFKHVYFKICHSHVLFINIYYFLITLQNILLFLRNIK